MVSDTIWPIFVRLIGAGVGVAEDGKVGAGAGVGDAVAGTAAGWLAAVTVCPEGAPLHEASSISSASAPNLPEIPEIAIINILAGETVVKT